MASNMTQAPQIDLVAVGRNRDLLCAGMKQNKPHVVQGAQESVR